MKSKKVDVTEAQSIDDASKLPGLFIPIMDNGMKLLRKEYMLSVIRMLIGGVIANRRFMFPDLSFPYPDTACNVMSYLFLKSGMDEMLILDTDLKFEPKHISMLLSHDVPLITGIHPKKCLGLVLPIVPLKSNPEPFAVGSPDVVEVEKAPRGIMKIQRAVFELLIDHPEVKLHYNSDLDDRMWSFWQQTPGGESDDFNFCRRYREVGGRVLVDQRCLVEHAGSAVYPIKGTYQE